MVMAAVPVIVGRLRTRGAMDRLRRVAPLVSRLGMCVNMLMRRAVVVMDKHMGVPVNSNRRPLATRQPEDREERSEDSNSQHGGGHPHRTDCTGLPTPGPLTPCDCP